MKYENIEVAKYLFNYVLISMFMYSCPGTCHYNKQTNNNNKQQLGYSLQLLYEDINMIKAVFIKDNSRT